MKIALTLFILSVCFIQIETTAQTPILEDRLPAVQSPNVTAMDQYGKIPVSLFNGLPEITVPLGSFKCGEIDVPITLRYNASGNKPDLHPAWVGLGWNLEANGVITRQINGDPDEKNYFIHKGELAASNWKDSAFMYPRAIDLQPDEYTIAAPGLSATIFLNYDGNWLVKSKEGISLKVVYQYDTLYTAPFPNGSTFIVNTAVTKFQITDNRGFVYVFGGQSNAIEFNYPALPSINDFGTPDAMGDYFAVYLPRKEVLANAWYLTSITSPSGHNVKFQYDAASSNTFTQGTYDSYWSFSGSPSEYSYEVNGASKALTPTFYLTRIVGDDSLACDFYKSSTNDLSQVWKNNVFSDNDFSAYNQLLTPSWTYYKLDSLKIKWGQSVIKNVKLEYTDVSSQRLKLNKVSYLDTQSQPVNFYSFTYSTKALPDYNSHQIDHWGYWNGRYQFTSGHNQFSQAWADDYYAFRETDTAYVDAEILQKITYPTGGYSRFYFEPHTYSAYVQQYPDFVCSTLTVNKFAGGLRIKMIENFDGIKKTGRVEYKYVKNYLANDTLSSGILAGKPNYFETATALFGIINKLSSSPLNFLNTTSGSHITYSEVVEIRPESGYIVHYFSNHDNGYMDRSAFKAIGWQYLSTKYYQNKIFGKTEIERGLLLKKKYYDLGKVLLKEELYEYNDDTARFNYYARANALYDWKVSGATTVWASFPIFSYHPYLKSTITKEYHKGSTTPITIYTRIAYDTTYRLPIVQKRVNTEGDTITVTKTYPFNYIGIGKPVYDSMFKYNVLDKIVEQKQYLVSTLTNQQKNEFGFYNGNKLFAPKFQTSAIYDNTPDTIVSYMAYDEKGNLKEAIPQTGRPATFLYNYNKSYQVAQVVNASLADVAYTSFETDSANGWSVSLGSPATVENAGGITGKREHQFDAGATRPITRSGINSSGKYIVSFWFKGIEPTISGSGLSQSNKITAIQDNGWKYVQVIITGATAISIVNPSGQTGVIDELRMYPVSAEMTTYTYLPGIGISSICDVNSRLTYYEYDLYGRLQTVKDKDGNILKKMEYKFLQ